MYIPRVLDTKDLQPKDFAPEPEVYEVWVDTPCRLGRQKVPGDCPVYEGLKWEPSAAVPRVPSRVELKTARYER